MQFLLEVLRVLLGICVVLFAPGYSFLAAAFPRAADLEVKERLGLAFALSVAISSPMVLILDKFPGGLGSGPVAIAFIGFIVGCTAIATYRRRRLPESDRLAINFWARRYWAVGLALGMALAGSVVMTSSPAPGEGYNEFYVLGIHGSAEDYAREAMVGQPVEVVCGISNREGGESGYRVEVYQDEVRIGWAGPYRLEDGEGLEAAVTFTPVRAGEDVRMQFYLFKDGSTQPYRLLELWVKVRAQDR